MFICIYEGRFIWSLWLVSASAGTNLGFQYESEGCGGIWERWKLSMSEENTFMSRDTETHSASNDSDAE